MLVDFDGSLSRIVARPELALPVEGAREVLAALVPAFRLVGIVTGRRAEEVAALVEVSGVSYFGLYGLEDAVPELMATVAPLAESAAAVVAEAWVEYKGVSVAVHYRQAPDPRAARAALLTALQPVATSTGLDVVEGKMVLELLPADRPRKGGAVERIAREHALEAVLFAGDDVADLDAFSGLDRLAARGVLALRVAVHGDETPEPLLEAADVVVDGPDGLVELLRQLA